MATAQDIAISGDLAKIAKKAGISQEEVIKLRRERFSGKVTSDEGLLGDIESREFSIRSALPATGTGRRAASFASGGVNIHAPFGKEFELFEGGGVREVDFRPRTPEEIESDKTRKFTGLFDQPTPGREFIKEDITLTAPEGKTIKRQGQTIKNPKTGVEEEAKPGEILIEYTDGTVERRKVSGIQTPGETTKIEEFGRTAEELGIDRGTEIKGGEGLDVTRAPQSAAEIAELIDTGQLEYIGKEYVAENGEKRVAGEGKAFYQDPESRKILERDDVGQGGALQSTSPSILASRRDIPGTFQAVFGREPNAEELAYWQGRTDKSGAALVGAMQFAKRAGSAIGGEGGKVAAGDDLQSQIVTINSEANSNQEASLSSIKSEFGGADLSGSAKLALVNKALGDRPDVPSVREERQKELNRIGFFEDADDLLGAERAVKQLDADFLSTLEGEEGRRVSMGQIRRRQSAQEIIYNRLRRDLIVERDYLSNKVAQKQTIVNTMISDLGQDIANAQSNYQFQFNAAIQMTNLIRGIEQDQLALQQKQKDEARANLQIMSNMIIAGNVNYDQLDASTRAELRNMEIQSGWPSGFTQFISKAVKEPITSFLPSYVDEGGNRIQPVGTINPSTGAFEIKNINQGKTDFSLAEQAAQKRKIGDGKETESEIGRAARSDMAVQLNARTGLDGYVSPPDFRSAREAWTNQGYSSSDFNENFIYLVNPGNPQGYGARFKTDDSGVVDFTRQ